jgi:hypothetical protein
MPFMVQITLWLASIRDYFLDAHYTVSNWVWPFYNLATPLYYIYNAFYWLVIYFYQFNEWLYELSVYASSFLDMNIVLSYLQTWINYATIAYNWIINAANIITYNIGAWWNTTQQTVLVWIDQAKQWALVQVNNLANTLAPVIAGWNSFVSKIPSLNEILLWFTNWWANVLSRLSSWWTERLLDIKALFNSWTLDLAPFWLGWQEIRDKVFEFFNDPLEWLLAEFTDWFLGKE